MFVVGGLQSLVRNVERVGILHHEFAATQNARTRTSFVAVLRLNLVERDRQILVRRILTLHHQGEHFFVSRAEQVIVLATILQAEQVSAVFSPAIRLLVGLARQQSRKMNLLEASGIHLFTDDALNIAVGDKAKG